MKLSTALLCLLACLVSSSVGAQTAFRLTSLELKDPHVYTSIIFFGCTDITNSVPLGLGPSLNESVEESILSDANGDGLLDLSPILYFFPTQTAVATGGPPVDSNADPEAHGGEIAFHVAACDAPVASTVCDADPAEPVFHTFYDNSLDGGCFAPPPGTLRPYSPSLQLPNGECFLTEPFPVVLTIGGIEIELEDARVSASYSGDPTSTLLRGVLAGFLPEALADVTFLPASVPVVGGERLSRLLPGGDGSCTSHDDRDLGPDGQTMGWWIYLNFEAAEVPFLAVTGAPGFESAAAEPARLRLASPSPNPLRERSSIAWVGIPGTRARVDVVDVTGRLVRSLANEAARASVREVSWDGRDSRGERVGAGVYFVRLSSGELSRARKVVVAR